MKSVGEMDRAELGAYVQEHLRSASIDTVLSGGACVHIYSHGAYVSMDLDLINLGFTAPRHRELENLMAALNFKAAGRHYKHSENELFIEFPPGPPSVGEESVKTICELHVSTGMLKIISPTDCVKDRLTWFYHDKDRQCLEQAIDVAHCQKVDLVEIERWSAVEGKLREFYDFKQRLTTPPFE